MRYEEISQLEFYGKVFMTLKSRSHRSTANMAIWPNLNGTILDRECNTEDIRVGLLEYLMSHTPKIAGMPDQAHILAKVKWFQDHPRKNWFRNSIALSATLSEGDSEASFVLIGRIMSRCACKRSIQFDFGVDSVIVAMPLTRRVIDK